MKKPENMDAYLHRFPPYLQDFAAPLRKAIKEAAPDALETISYGMPAFKLNGILCYFALHNHHLGFYPTGSGIEAFKHEFTGYKWSKGAVQFPYDKPLPLDLISKIVHFRVAENMTKVRKPAKGKPQTGNSAKS
jgi:uncharacterized protein YdhG (YjbR/CyaY superfamily)